MDRRASGRSRHRSRRMIHCTSAIRHRRRVCRQGQELNAGQAGLVNRLIPLFVLPVGRAAIVAVQNPVQLNNYTELQPALLLLRLRDDFYVEVLPQAADVLLLVEVSDTTLAYDRQEKLP